MIIPKREDAKHKYQMFRLLKAILNDKRLKHKLMFKGGTYAALRGELDRFSIDLDFDLPGEFDIKAMRQACYKNFKKLGLKIKDESKKYLQFFLQYSAKPGERNTLKLEIADNPSKKNMYEKVHLKEINMYCNGHSIDTMVANKMVAAMARFDRTGKIAGRDFYDLHHFLLNGLEINKAVVEDLTGEGYIEYLKKLTKFIEKEVTVKLLNQDLNPLLPVKQLNRVVGGLKEELIGLFRDEIKRMS